MDANSLARDVGIAFAPLTTRAQLPSLVGESNMPEVFELRQALSARKQIIDRSFVEDFAWAMHYLTSFGMKTLLPHYLMYALTESETEVEDELVTSIFFRVRDGEFLDSLTREQKLITARALDHFAQHYSGNQNYHKKAKSAAASLRAALAP